MLSNLVNKVNSGVVHFDRYVKSHSKSTLKEAEEAINMWDKEKNNYRQKNVDKLEKSRY